MTRWCSADQGRESLHGVPNPNEESTVERVEAPDYQSRSVAGVAHIFEHFGVEEAPQIAAHLYSALCDGIHRDPELLALAAIAPTTQPPPNLLFGAVHYLLLRGAEHPLREFYPGLTGGSCRPPSEAFESFRTFCLEHRAEIASLVATKLTQTNVIQRCMFLLPAFATVFRRGGGRPLALIEIGPSAGLNMQWHRFRYAYAHESGVGDRVVWGDPDAKVSLETVVRGEIPLPSLPAEMTVAWRRGIDLNPVDVADPDAVDWLRALIWPEHVERQERLSRAIDVAQEDPPEIVRGDAADGLVGLIEAAPRDATLCVYGTHTLYQFPKEALRSVFHGMQRAAANRPIYFVGCEGTGDRCSELRLTSYAEEGREQELLANCNPHGRWVEWLGAPVR
jgi:hypothetical protein